MTRFPSNKALSAYRLPMKRSATLPLDSCAYRSVSINHEGESSLRRSVASPAPKRVKTWHVTDDSPQSLPTFPLEKTKVTIDRCSASPAKIATRISDALRTMSIDATFNDKKATASLLTEDDVTINITLFKDENEGTIVEVQRMQGCGASFHRHSRLILRAAQGVSTLPSKHVSQFKVPRTIQSESLLLCQHKEHTNCLLALELANSLLKLDQLDANRLGMESLCALTNPNQSSTITAILAGQAVLFGRVFTCYKEQRQGVAERDLPPFGDGAGKNSVAPNIRDSVVNLIENDPIIMAEGNDANVQERHALRRLALVVFSNSLNAVIRNSGRSNQLFTRMNFPETHKLVLALVKLLKGADRCGCDAYLAAKCFGALLEVSTDALDCSRKLGVVPIVRQALDVGCKRHTKLQKEAERLLRLVV